MEYSIMKSMYNNYKHENIFLIFAIVFGTGFVFITPPFQAPDEDFHFYTAYKFSDLDNILKQDKYIPKSLIVTADTFINMKFHSERKTNVEQILKFVNFPLDRDDNILFQINLYSPIPYIPQIVGLTIGKIFDLSPLILMYLGRIANLIIWILLMYLATRISPVGKWLFFLLALTPMSLFQAASLSPDAVTNGISFLTISMFLYYLLDEKKQRINKYDILIIILLSSILSLSKQIYAIMFLLFILIPIKKFNSKKEYISVLALLLSTVVSLNIFWFLYNNVTASGYFPTGVSMSEQFHYIINNPLNYISILTNTMSTLQQFYIDSFIGILGWLDTPLPDYIYNSYIPMLLLVSISDKRDDISISWKIKSIIGMIIFSGIILIMTTEYLIYTKVGNGLIIGAQGRHFIPISPLLFLLFYNNKKILVNTLKRNFHFFITGYSYIVLSISIYYTIQRYYA